ncbi:hypothetical protein SAMN05444354_1148 [Stigmatella aurantiaca]|uniref:Uncharacterized protein n=1 Tax=Stigmatella aurantiaca TaxID=41 RepID=A0A1H7WXK3_STIAU|nr:hypothetical protein [Stigmatella aurantiaca]SEM26332.1 hypothetical protein SAMN05444354_1148 [Stigmatella aurantiaca]
MTNSRIEPEVDFGELGATPAVQFWNAMLGAVSSLWQEQFLYLSSLSTSALTAQNPGEVIQKGLLRLAMNWFSLVPFPFEWWTRYTQQVPSVFFVLDQEAQTASPVTVPLPIVLGEQQRISVTKLQKVGGGAFLPGTIFSIECIDRTLLRVKPVSLKQGNGLKEPGLYLGLIYTQNNGERHPLALLCVLHEETETISSPEPGPDSQT